MKVCWYCSLNVQQAFLQKSVRAKCHNSSHWTYRSTTVNTHRSILFKLTRFTTDSLLLTTLSTISVLPLKTLAKSYSLSQRWGCQQKVYWSFDEIMRHLYDIININWPTNEAHHINCSSCTNFAATPACQNYEDVWDELRGHEDHITALEEQCRRLNSNIEALRPSSRGHSFFIKNREICNYLRIKRLFGLLGI